MYTFQTVFMCTCVRYVCVEGGGFIRCVLLRSGLGKVTT